MNGLKHGDSLSPLLFNFALEYQDGLILNGTQQLLVYADDIDVLVGSVNTIKENAEALVFFSMEIGIEVTADKTKYMFMSRDQNAGRRHNIKFDYISFERVEECKFLRTTITNSGGN